MDFLIDGIGIEEASYEQFCRFLQKNGNAQKAEFDAKIIKTNMKLFGLYSNQIADISKYLLNRKNKLFDYPSDRVYEVAFLQGLLIAKDKSINVERKTLLLSKWAESVDNWAHVDGVCSKIYCKKEDKKFLFEYALRQARRKREFEARCGVIILFQYISEEYLPRIFELFDSLDYGRYYVDMAVAWFCATALINYKSPTLDFLQNSSNITDFVYQKSLQKARESFRISPEDKEEYKVLLRSKKAENK